MESIGETSPGMHLEDCYYAPPKEWDALEPNIQEDLLDAIAEDLEIAATEETVGAFQRAGLSPGVQTWRGCFRYLFNV